VLYQDSPILPVIVVVALPAPMLGSSQAMPSKKLSGVVTACCLDKLLHQEGTCR
jgi:hypothetical protein